MFPLQYQDLVIREQRKDLMREAEKERLLKSGLMLSTRRSFLSTSIAWFESRITTLSCSLFPSRFAPVCTPPIK